MMLTFYVLNRGDRRILCQGWAWYPTDRPRCPDQIPVPLFMQWYEDPYAYPRP